MELRLESTTRGTFGQQPLDTSGMPGAVPRQGAVQGACEETELTELFLVKS